MILFYFHKSQEAWSQAREPEDHYFILSLLLPVLFSEFGYFLVWIWGPLIIFWSVLLTKLMCVKYFYSPLSFFSSANTSCGLPLKMLRKTPIYTCGTYLVMLVPPPGGSGSSATRSLFGGTSGLSSLKSKWILFLTFLLFCCQLCWHLGCLYFLVILNNANIHVQVFVFISLGFILWSWILG